MDFRDDNAALQWCVENDVSVRIDPEPNSMEPYQVRFTSASGESARFRTTCFQEAAEKFTRWLEKRGEGAAGAAG